MSPAALVERLRAYQSRGVFNPYCECDAALDRCDAADIRCANLCAYLQIFAGAAYVLVGEAPGYAGCRFSGLPFTSEAQLVGVEQLSWVAAGRFAQSSLAAPWRERSASAVWAALGERRDCVLWNAFPWHPFANKPLSNRQLTRNELRQAQPVWRDLAQLFPEAQVFAVGRVAQRALHEMGVAADYIRHPAHGGQPAFAQALGALPVLGATH